MSDIVNGAEINETHANVNRTRSTFPLKQGVLDTHRFGEYHPHFVLDGITSDKHSVRSAHVARSYTLKAPLMQDIQMHKDYFLVTQRSILPFQSDRITANPTIGDDVPSDAYTNVSDFISKVDTISSLLLNAISTEGSQVTPSKVLINTLFFKWLVFVESIFSNGSLLASLGCNLSNRFDIFDSNSSTRPKLSIDDFVDRVISDIISSPGAQSVSVSIDGVSYVIMSSVPDKSDPLHINWRQFLCMIRDTADWTFLTESQMFWNAYSDFVSNASLSFNIWISNDLDLDISRPWSYQLSCAEFYTNDKVDYIYSAELFRQYIFSLYCEAFVTLTQDVYTHFSWNGFSLPYDYLSSHFFDLWVQNTISNNSSVLKCALQYFIALFGYKRSLRFKDYFTGSRTRPLAVGAASGSNSTNVPVVSNQVSVVDVSRSIQVQRFLNAVNATGRKFEEYLKGIFGVAPSPDHHCPLFLAHSTDSIFASEVQNTGDAQWDTSSGTGKNSVTAVFRGNGNQFEYSVEVDEPSIIIGITSYDIERAYCGGIERCFFTKDRFDMFLPQLQYVGDQPVYSAELDSGLGTSSNFGYQFRDMQWKQLVNRACGAFANGDLPGYAFLWSRYKFGTSSVISPDFIRSKQVELDDFYLSLTGYSLATYFHFIVINYNSDNASRPMAYNPQILG